MVDEPPAEARTPRPAGGRRRARRMALGIFYAVVVSFTVALSLEITWQVWSPARHSYEPTSCRAGLIELDRTLQNARFASEGFEGSPEEAVALFRQKLSPVWDARDRIVAACRDDLEGRAAFDVVERLRYAEENAIRRDARDLSPLRRRERLLRDGLLRPGP